MAIFASNFVRTLMILSSALFFKVNSEEQFLSIFKNPECENALPEYIFQSTSNDVHFTEDFKQGYFAYRGIWRITMCQEQSSCLHPQEEDSSWGIILHSNDEIECTLHPFNLKTSNFTTIRRFGDPSMSESSLGLFSEDHFTGDEITIPSSKSFDDVKFIKSLYFTGPSEWTLYDDVDFNGKSTCLEPSETVLENDSGYTLQFLEDYILVGSVRKGCFKANEREETEEEIELWDSDIDQEATTNDSTDEPTDPSTASTPSTPSTGSTTSTPRPPLSSTPSTPSGGTTPTTTPRTTTPSSATKFGISFTFIVIMTFGFISC